jgi:DNA-binding transcriptional MerR regulator
MKALHRGDLAAALTIIDARHAELAQKRLQVEQTLAALQAMTGHTGSRQSSEYTQPVRVGDAARELGVRVSALYFWEERGLLHPFREHGSRYRLYDEQQMRRLRVVVLLREAGYDFTVIEAVLDELTAGRPEKAIVAVEKRREDLTRTSWLCLDALPDFQQYVYTFCADQLPTSRKSGPASTWIQHHEI